MPFFLQVPLDLWGLDPGTWGVNYVFGVLSFLIYKMEVVPVIMPTSQGCLLALIHIKY